MPHAIILQSATVYRVIRHRHRANNNKVTYGSLGTCLTHAEVSIVLRFCAVNVGIYFQSLKKILLLYAAERIFQNSEATISDVLSNVMCALC